jgi:hypothetical protein
MTFDEALAQLDIAVREHGAAIEELVARLRTSQISRESSSCLRSVHSSKRSKGSWRN